MLRRLLDQSLVSDYVVIFCNTGKEREETLEFVRDVERNWEIPVVWLEYHRVPAISIQPGIFPTAKRNDNLAKAASRGESTHWFREVNYHLASREGEPFNELLEWMSVLPNVVSRGCSTQLKIRTAMRYLFSLGVKTYSPVIGIRKDEEHRAIQILTNCDNFETPKFPLIEMGVTESDVLRFWSTARFDLKLKSYEGNCDLCFLKAKWKRVLLERENPGMAKWWADWEQRKATATGNGKYFRLGEPYADIQHLAAQPEQAELCFAPSADIACSCAERGFGSDE